MNATIKQKKDVEITSATLSVGIKGIEATLRKMRKAIRRTHPGHKVRNSEECEKLSSALILLLDALRIMHNLSGNQVE